jgi:hypothetical protein
MADTGSTVQVQRDDAVRMCTALDLAITALQTRNGPPHLIQRVEWVRETLMHSLWPNAAMDKDLDAGVDEWLAGESDE